MGIESLCDAANSVSYSTNGNLYHLPPAIPPPTRGSPQTTATTTGYGSPSGFSNSPYAAMWSPNDPASASAAQNSWGGTTGGNVRTAAGGGAGGGGNPNKRARKSSSSAAANIKIDDEEEEDEASDEDEADGGGSGKGNGKGGAGGADGEPKKKSTRGSRACTVCRKLKMRCVGAEEDAEGRCKRCRNGGHECIFEESQRGRRSNRKSDAMAKSLKKMEETLENVLRSIGPGSHGVGAGMISEPGLLQRLPSSSNVGVAGSNMSLSPNTLAELSASPGALGGGGVPLSAVSAAQVSAGTQAFNSTPGAHQNTSNLLYDNAGGLASNSGSSRVEWSGLRSARGQEGSGRRRDHESPRLHSLPDNTLNP